MIDPTRLRGFLKDLEGELGEDGLGAAANAARIEHYYRNLQISREIEAAVSLENYQSTNTAGQSALKSTFLINGGAAVATAAFFGTLVSNGSSTAISETELGFTFLVFGFGTAASVVASSFTYLAMYFGSDDTKFLKKFGWKSFNGLAVGSGALSIISFLSGLAMLGCFFAF